MLKKKKLMPFALLLTAIAVTGAGCGNKSDTPNSTPNSGSNSPGSTTTDTTDKDKDKTNNTNTDNTEKVKDFKMTIRHINVRETSKNALKLLEEVAQKTESENPGLKFELDGVEDVVNRDQKLKAEMAGGNPPPIFNLFGGDDTRNYAKAGRLLDLTPILTELGIKDKFLNLGEFTVDGKVYGLPESGFVEGFFYNKTMFADAGVEPPKTWEEFLDVNEKLKAKGNIPISLGGGSGDAWAINMLINTMFVRLGGMDIQEKFLTGEAKWTDAPVVEAFAKLIELKDKGYLDKSVLAQKYGDQQAKFYTGQAAMSMDGSWAMAGIVGDKSTVKEEAGFFNFPNMGGPGDNTINGGFSNGYGFSSKVADDELQLKAVKSFIKNFYTEENQLRELVDSGRLPAMKLSNTGNAEGLIVDVVKVQSQQEGAFPAFDAIVQASVKKTLETVAEELVGGKTTPEKAAETVQKAQEEANKADQAK
ncbi:extracellular solute-binding protein [Paenibacillus sp. GCM10027626]|uniref:extracellular solute-binding protein n=1 Tax=Paenibacillus sp. GCM10027626 TaxID=3273411 RepID=UPI00362F2B1B